jgi:integrase
MWETGIRVSELLALTPSSIDFAAEARLFPITRQRVHQIVRRAAEAAGLPRDRAHLHTMRHSFAIACVLARVPVLVLAEWLGHASLEATLVYTRILCADSRRYLGDVDLG